MTRQEPVVVQGTAVSAPTATNSSSYGNNSSSYGAPSSPPTTTTTTTTMGSSGQGEKQATRCRDPVFAVLFYAVLFALVGLAAALGPDALAEDDGSNNGNFGSASEYRGYIGVVVIVIGLSFVTAAAGLLLMMAFPGFIIKTSLIVVVALMGLIAIATILVNLFGGIIMLAFFGLMLCYARAVWSRIPFATVNLVTACTAVKSNWGVIIYAFVLTIAAGAYSLVWSVAVVGVMDATSNCDNESDTCDDPSYFIIFLLLVAFYFGQQVFQNTIHVTVAGMMGNWWFEPSEASSCCSSAVNNAFLRSVTTSFGSICFGSLIVAILEALRALARMARENDDAGIMACIAECILDCLASLVEYFNKWAYVYVGLYGYPYMEAGKNVFTLFKNRGWEAVIADDLVGNALFFVALVAGAVMGLVGLGLSQTSLLEDAAGNPEAIGFFLGFLVGLVICNIVMNTIGSAVNAVIVLFAEAPNEFQNNYPELSNKMLETWRDIYPGSV